MIAVIIPTFKPDKYIKDCLSSLQTQTISKDLFKVYIALNGSKEPYLSNIQEILSNCDFSYEIHYFEKANVSNARNKMLDIIKEDYIIFLDDDDILSYNYLENLSSVTSNNVMGVCDLRTFEGNLDISGKNYISEAYAKLDIQEFSKFKFRSYLSSPVAKMLHKDMISNIRFNTNVNIGEDSLFMMQISPNISSIKKAPYHTCYYTRIRANSTTRRKSRKVKELIRINYLISQYTAMLFSQKHSKLLVLSRIVATIKHLRRIFK